VGGKKNKGKVPENHAKRTPKKPKNIPQPPRRWWNAILDTNKIIAGGTVALALLAAATIYYNNRQWHEEHRPLVVFSRPLELLKPLTCDPLTGQGSDSVRAWVKNIGNVDAQSVLMYPFVHLIPETPSKSVPQGQSIQDILNMGRFNCSFNRAPGGLNVGFPLAAGKEISVDMPGSIASTVHYLGQTRMQAFSTSFVSYLEPDKKTTHTTTITE
jgi:hypothetical protein